VWDDLVVRRNIIEGEPGIFPDPVARVFRAVGRVFGRRDRRDRRGGDERSGSGSGSGDGGPLTAEELSDLDSRAKPRPGPERPPD
jgi:hypothetical protein